MCQQYSSQRHDFFATYTYTHLQFGRHRHRGSRVLRFIKNTQVAAEDLAKEDAPKTLREAKDLGKEQLRLSAAHYRVWRGGYHSPVRLRQQLSAHVLLCRTLIQ